ncbi:hypothetical protein EMIHUDRAFT_194970 [Emiliania huxleyi CCMP1516]|uniref:MFS transporter n=2 Tax=Emiliania huxleyi TaxID=2903 RepID=A0A0D3JGQ1_EMIH1|nr:hypothetical protein EMIHUDRAFT_194970 [Emiliania huxleyi CCMP1516]EOD22686.1 hypothetical protein EMIHUDRAFT_194970 [Emiliania huxleyi CCMP1516]|eukprot:XP_005775115.1 hypothetical protein EMIHUDRAFT_194970 [Emiliania huxleyi CCMP1516]
MRSKRAGLLLGAAAAASALLPSPSPLRSPPTTDAALRVATSGRDGLLARLADGDGWLIALVVFAVPSALYAHLGQDRVATAAALGRISSSAALLDILVTPQLGRLSDTIGRKPLLVGAPALALLCRGFGFVRLFRNGVALRSLASVSALHTTSMAMGDTWQIRRSDAAAGLPARGPKA